MWSKKLFRFTGVTILLVTILTIVAVTVYGEVFAITTKDIDTARQNVAVKVLAKNLSECYDNAQTEVDFQSSRAWDYTSKNATTYWSDPNMQVSYPKVLAGKTGNEESSNCGKMITGWHTNWIVKLFTDRGDFVGVDQNVVVPGNTENEIAFWDDVRTMRQYMEGIGYTAETTSDTHLNGYQCVYFHMTGYDSAFAGTSYLRPIDNSLNFISRETYCVPMQEGSDNIDFNKEMVMYHGVDNYEAFYRDGDTTLNKFELNPMDISAAFNYNHLQMGDGFGKKTWFFLVTINQVRGYYEVNDPNYSTTTWNDRMLEVVNNGGEFNNNAVNNCPVNIWTGAISKYYHCSLTVGVPNGDPNPTMSFDDFKNKFTYYILGLKVGGMFDNGQYQLFSSVTPLTLDPSTATATFKKGDVDTFVDYFFDQSGRKIIADGYALDTVEQYMFYYDHLKNYFGKDAGAYLYDSADAAPDTKPVLWLNEGTGEMEHKYIAIQSNTDRTACALVNNAWPGSNCGNNQQNWEYFADKLGSFDEEALADEYQDIKPLDDDYSDAVIEFEQENGKGKTSCMKDGGKALGWILCPLLELAGEAVESAYTNFLEPQLQINPELLAGYNGNSPTQEAWSVFRNFANIIFVIMLLVVIFSQLTGIGIDNYGIKRTLPKLIIAAILVNLSYIICQLCVDVSNIIGNGIQNLLESINFTAADSTLSGWEITGTGLMTSVGIIGAVVGGIIFVVYNPATLLTLLLSIISALFAILFAFVLLVVRKAALVLLVILSPLAFVCYMLPNTKRLFSQWMKAGMDLLIVYPICGLLIGGGNFISRLLLVLNLESNGGDGGFLAALIAMLAGIIPLFMIPTILRGAFSSMGSLGAKISGAGKRISGGITRGLDKSNTFANARQAGSEHTARMLGGVDKNGNPKQLSGFGKLIRGGTRNIARNRLKHLNNEDDKAKADFLVNQGSVGYEAEKVAREKSSKNNRVDAWEKLINSRTNNGENEKAFNDVVGEYAAKGNVDGLVAAARIAGRRKDSADSFIARWLTGNGKEGEEPIENSALRQAVAKEIATGSNSSNYMSSNPFRFEYASQLNNGKISDPSLSYGDWLRDKDKDGFYHNAGTALNNYVNNSQQLLAMKGSAFTELLGNDGELLKGLDSGTQDKMYGLARDTISNHDKGTGPWEADKAKHVRALASFGPSQVGAVVEESGSPAPTGAAQEGESFSTRGAAAGSTSGNGGGWYNTSTSNTTGNSAEGWYNTSTASAGGASSNVSTATNVNVNGPATVSAGTSTATAGRTDAGAQAGGAPAQSSDNKADLARITREMKSIDNHLDRLGASINGMAGQMAVGAAQQPRILQTSAQAPQVMPNAFGVSDDGGLALRKDQLQRSQDYTDVGKKARDIESMVKIGVSDGSNGSPIWTATGGGQALDTQLRLNGDRRPTQAPSRQANNNGGGNAGGNSGGA